MSNTRHVETVVIGGGQAGLATGYHLQQEGREFVILDASARIGDSWRNRWPSLQLYSPAWLDGLPGMPFPAPSHSFPTGREMADYLEVYAARFEFPVVSGARVQSLERNSSGYVVITGDERLSADNVVVATGVFQHDRPFVPEFAPELNPEIRQLHSADYTGPEQLQPGPVLVVGAAHSGGDIAYEVARAGFETTLVGRDTGQLAVDLESRKARLGFVVLRFLWTRVLTVSTPLGRKAKKELRTHGGPLLRVKRVHLEAAGVHRVLERVVGVADGKPMLADERVADAANVIWCTGFRNDYSWIRFPVPVEDDGFPAQRQGVVPTVPGLYFVGLPFLHSFASMLILGAGRDGRRVARHIAARGARATSAEPSRRFREPLAG